jgi:heptosyltransferase III
MKKVAVFSCPGLGDGVVSLILANNLFLNNYDVDLFHDNNFKQISSWVPHVKIKEFPLENIESILEKYELIFISYDAASKFIQELIQKGKELKKDKVIVVNPSPSKRIGRQPYYTDTFFDPTISVADNIKMFIKNKLCLEKATKSCGFVAKNNLIHRKHLKRVILHPTSGKASRNWHKCKYIKLALQLKKLGFNPFFIFHSNDKNQWESLLQSKFIYKDFSNLNELADCLFESGFMIGNDSGIVHLASALGIPTLSIFRNIRNSYLWRPGSTYGEVVYPSRLVPNISGFRLRDKKWKDLISVRKVLNKFKKIYLKTNVK